MTMTVALHYYAALILLCRGVDSNEYKYKAIDYELRPTTSAAKVTQTLTPF
jgi:hypothetical protein